MTTIDKEINAIMISIAEILTHCEEHENSSKLDKLNNSSAKILIKEIHLCILRHTYRIDNIRHNYDTIEEPL